MRRLLALGLAAGLLPSLALATGNHPMAGCGLGYLLLSNKDNTKSTQILGGTTNMTFGTQTFGITSGTSGCTEDGAVKMARATEVFMEINLSSLQQEMAAGQGEYVNALASMLGASEANRPAMVRFFQTEYQHLFPTSDTSSDEVLSRLAERLAQHPELLG